MLTIKVCGMPTPECMPQGQIDRHCLILTWAPPLFSITRRHVVNVAYSLRTRRPFVQDHDLTVDEIVGQGSVCLRRVRECGQDTQQVGGGGDRQSESTRRLVSR